MDTQQTGALQAAAGPAIEKQVGSQPNRSLAEVGGVD
jgi:hypothetical protein